MGTLLNIITRLHKKTKRDYMERMDFNKADFSRIARKFDFDYWDGNRAFGYGGYHYDGRWEPVAKALIKKYNLCPKARILDVGCGKGYLLYELKKLLPKCTIKGIDISPYAVLNAKPEIRQYIKVGRAECASSYHSHRGYDLVISLNTLHNLHLPDFERAIGHISGAGESAYIVMDSYRTLQELVNLQCWTLTCNLFFTPDEWRFLFEKFKYWGDYEFIYFT